MKILICTFGFYPEKHGVAIAAGALAEGLTRSGHTVVVATGGRFDSRLPPELADIEVHRFDVRGTANPRSRYRGEISRYVEFVSSTDADVAILACWQIWSTDLAVQALPLRVKVVLASHGVTLDGSGEGLRRIISRLLWKPYALWQMPRILRRIDRLALPTARLTGDRFYDHRLAIACGSAIEVIPNTARPRPAREGFRRRRGINTPFMALLVGNFAPLKNQLLAAEAFHRMQREDVTLVLAGAEENSYSAQLREVLQRWVPHRWQMLIDAEPAELWGAYLECDLTLITSLTEYQPLVALEAMSAGKPVVSTDVGCVGDLPGCTVVPSNPGAMAAAIESLLDAPERRQAMGRAAAEAFRTSFAFDVVAGRWDRLVRTLASEARLSRED